MKKNENFAEVGQRIAVLRGRLTQSAFSKVLGVDTQTIGRWERGERAPDASALIAMATELEADIGYLLTGKTSAPSAAPALLRPDEEALLAHYRQAGSDGRHRIREIAKTESAGDQRRKPKAPPEPPQTTPAPGFNHIGNIVHHGGKSSIQVVGAGSVRIKKGA